MPAGKKFCISIFLLTMLIALVSAASANAAVADNSIEAVRYSDVLNEWLRNGITDTAGAEIVSAPAKFRLISGGRLLDQADSYGYHGSAVELQQSDSIEFTVDVSNEGLYSMVFDYLIVKDSLLTNECRIEVNGKVPYREAERIIFPALWAHEIMDFSVDRYQNEVMPLQKNVKQWQTRYMEDSGRFQPEPLKVLLNKGENTIRITTGSGSLVIGDIKLIPKSTILSYDAYADRHIGIKSPEMPVIKIEAEKYSYKDDNSIIPAVSRDMEVWPYDTNRLLLNTLGGTSWDRGGQKVYYDIKIQEDGLYKVAFRYIQNTKANSNVFRSFTIDGVVPFHELKHYAIPYTNRWRIHTLGTGSHEYLFYLTKGIHTIGIEADISVYSDVIALLMDVIEEINSMSMEIKKLTGNDADKYRDWDITDYIPDLDKRLYHMADAIDSKFKYAKEKNGDNKNSEALILMDTAVRLLRNLAGDPNKIPSRMKQLSEGTGSAAQVLAAAVESLESQPLQLDQIYIFGDKNPPEQLRISIFKRIAERIKRFFWTFTPTADTFADSEDAVDVWVNRPRYYMDIMNQLADEDFNASSPIRINFSLMPNEQKLILANASGTAPDVALGIGNSQPYELGVRGASLDLRSFNDFGSVISEFSPGALLPMIVDDKCYGLPETQDFFVLFYRKDIFRKLNLPVPNTWDEVTELLPELQRYGMNFYSTLSGNDSYKAFTGTAPFIFQHGGDILSPDGLGTTIDREASLRGIKYMTDLYTIYGLPLQVSNFYQHFRDGSLPIGVGTFYTYVQLLNAAPELRGLWAIAPSPGTINQDGEVTRWQPGTAQAAMIFKSSDHPQESWELLKWWMSSETQTRFAYQLQALYGGEYMWNTANIEAFRQLPWNEGDKKVILEQWRWLREVPRIPGSYMVERELSNVWNKVIFDGKNLRAEVDDSVIRSNTEILRKLEEFGYLQSGRVVYEYNTPTIESVEAWMKGVLSHR